MELTSGRRGGRASDKAGVRDIAMDAKNLMYTGKPADPKHLDRAWQRAFFNSPKNLSYDELDRIATEAYEKDKKEKEGKDEYRDEEFEEGEFQRGKQDDRDAAKIDRHGRWGSRASDKSGARDTYATDPPVSEAQRKAMFAAKAGNSTLGIPQSVGKEFAEADPGGKLPSHK